MQSLPLVRHVLRDDSITRGLGDIEARMIVEWLVDRVEQIASTVPTEAAGWAAVRAASRRARTIVAFVRLWSDPATRGAAGQLAAVERVHWPFPASDADPGQVMESILAWTDRQDEIIAESLSRRAA